MPKSGKRMIEVDDETMDAILDHQRQHRHRSRRLALAELVQKGASLDLAERGGFDLAPVLKLQLEEAVRRLEMPGSDNDA